MDLVNDSFVDTRTEIISIDDIKTNRFGVDVSQLSSGLVQQEVETPPIALQLNNQCAETVSIAAKVLNIEKNLSSELEKLAFSPPVAYVYNPLTYAWETHSIFVSKYANTKKKILFVGMNPGPWGMVQTGVSTIKSLWSPKYFHTSISNAVI